MSKIDIGDISHSDMEEARVVLANLNFDRTKVHKLRRASTPSKDDILGVLSSVVTVVSSVKVQPHRLSVKRCLNNMLDAYALVALLKAVAVHGLCIPESPCYQRIDKRVRYCLDNL